VLQTLFHIPNSIGGVPLFGFGLLLALWAVGSVVFLLWLVRRQGFNNDTKGYIPLLLVIGAAIWLVLPHLCDAHGLPIRGYGMMLLLAVVSAVGLAVWRARCVGLDPDLVFNLAFWCFVPGLIGARMFYVIQKWPLEFDSIYQTRGGLAALGAVLNVAQGGLVVYGSVIGGIIGAVAFIYKYKLPPLATLDLAAPSLALGMAIGRLGCMMNGCCYGGECQLPWAVQFPAGSPVHYHQFFEGELAVYGLKLHEHPQQLPLISQVVPGSPAAQAGMAANDWIDTVGRLPTDTAQDVYGAMIEVGHAGQLPVELVGGQKHTWKTSEAMASDANHGAAALLGVKFVGPSQDRPILREVAPNSAAEKQGLKAGQELFAVGGRRVRTVADAERMLAQYTRPGLAVSLVTVTKRTTVEMPVAGPPARSNPVHPAQIYSAINEGLLCLFLLAYAPFRRRDGELTAMFLTLYPVSRFLIEVIRTDEPAVFGTGMSISQNVSLILLFSAIALWVSILLKPAGTTFPKFEPDAGK
jgi:phosphatidylglycerol:prolipoprotein diacylglycerol transferase